MLTEAFISVTFDNYSHQAQEFAREKKMSKRRKKSVKNQSHMHSPKNIGLNTQ